jgi:hypothetical protein
VGLDLGTSVTVRVAVEKNYVELLEARAEQAYNGAIANIVFINLIIKFIKKRGIVIRG